MYKKVLLSKPTVMATVSFKADDDFKKKLELLARKKGINTSAYIKLILTKGLNDELIEITENGLTIAEELAIVDSDKNDKTFGPYKTTKSLMKALRE